MNEKRTCPDSGVGIGEPHVNQCDIERCSTCDGQRITCDCPDHDPAKSVWTGEFPVQNSMEEPGFVIYDNGKPAPEVKAKPKVQQEERGYKRPSDDTMSGSCRVALMTHFYEPIVQDGKYTGEYRVCRNTKYDYRVSSEVPWEAILPSKEAVAEWIESKSRKEDQR